jgi:hypothetical protein
MIGLSFTAPETAVIGIDTLRRSSRPAKGNEFTRTHAKPQGEKEGGSCVSGAITRITPAPFAVGCQASFSKWIDATKARTEENEGNEEIIIQR